MVCHHRHHQQPCPRQRTRPFHPQLLQHINQRRRINQRRHTYHPSEVAEDKPTEAEDEEQVKVGGAGNLVTTKIKIVRRLERHLQRPEEPSRRAKQRPPAKRITQNTLTTGTFVSVAVLMYPTGTPARHAPPCVVRTAIRKDAIARTTRSMQHRGTRSA